MIPVLTGAGHRVIAPDLVGFGRSDKPTERTDYTYARHVEWMRAALFDELDLTRHHPRVPGLGRADRAAPAWPSTPIGSPGSSRPTRSCPPATATRARRSSTGGRSPRRSRRSRPAFIVNGGCTTDLDARGDRRLRRAVPRRVATRRAPASSRCSCPPSPDDPASRRQPGRVGGARTFDKPFLCAFGDSDPITARRRPDPEGADPRRRGPTAHHHRGRRPLHPGGPRPGAGRRSSSTSSRPTRERRS